MRLLNRLHSVSISALLCGLVVTIGGQSTVFAAKQGPPIRTGLWAMQPLPDNDGELSAFAAGVRANRELAGACIHIRWNDVQKEPGKLDFGAIDKTVSMLRGIGMKYQFCLQPGVNTPSFVYNEGAHSFATLVMNPHRANYGQPVLIPVPWDPIYQRDFSQTIKQLGERYSGDPLCVSVVLTCANFMSAEMHLPKTRDDLAKWKALGNYQEKLFEVYKKYTDEWATAFPRQEISLHLSKVLDLPPQFCERVIDYGLSKYPRRFSIQNCQLTGRRDDTGMMTYDLILKYRDRAHHGFQSLAGLSRPNARMGSIEVAALNIVHAEGEYWELWHGDGMSAETSTAVAKAWDEARRLGYDAYKKKLIAEGKYPQANDAYYRGKRTRRSGVEQGSDP
jgi:hypothetical protein